MKLLIAVVLIMVSAPILTTSAAGYSDPILTPAEPETFTDPHIHGISWREGTMLMIAVTDDSILAYQNITWFLWTPIEIEISHTCPVGSFSMTLPAGYHSFEIHYEAVRQTIIWTLDDVDHIFNLRISDRALLADPELPSGNMIEVDRNFELSIAAGAAIAALIPSIFIVPFWQARKNEGWESVFE